MATYNTYEVLVRARLQNTTQDTEKTAVRVATTAAVTLATDVENGDTVDGVVLVTGDRILVKNQAAPAENGIYIVAVTGAPTRATDLDAWAEVVGAIVSVTAGTANAGKKFIANVASGGTIGVTAMNWTLFDAEAVRNGVFPLNATTAGAASVLDVKLSVNGREVATAAGDPGATAGELATLAAALKQAVVDNID